MTGIAAAGSVGQAWRRDRERYGARAFHLEPTLWAVGAYRLVQWAQAGRGGRLLPPVARALSRLVGVVVGVELPPGAQIGPGLRIHHGGSVVVHARARIGRDCDLRQGVTLGERRSGGPVPVLGDGVDVGAHAQVLGGVHLGDGARIGALCLVLDDVPAGGSARAPKAEVVPPVSPSS